MVECRRDAVMVLLVCAGALTGLPAGAQVPGEETAGEVLSEEQLEQLLDSPTEQPSDGDLSGESFGLEQLSSHFSQGTLAQARAEFGRGRYRRVRALLAREEPTLPVRFLSAQSAFQGGDFAAAAEEFAVLADAYGALREHCLLRSAQAHERLRHWERAAGQYRAVSVGSPLYPEARFSLARVLERQRDVTGALGALEELIQSRQSRGPDAIRMKALMKTCDLARKQGLYNVEHRALLEVWATHPMSREAENARRRLAGLPLPIKWRVRRGEALVELHHNVAAMELIDRVLPHVALPDPLACSAHLTYGRALRKERKHRQAIQVLTPVAQQCDSPEVRPQALYVLGYSQSVVDPETAITTYATLARDYPEHGYADDALFFEAWLEQRTFQAEAALAHYEEVARRYPAGNFASEALFRAFWLHQRAGAPEAALASLQAVEELPLVARTDEALWRARYWHARALESQKNMEPVLSAYERIATERPASWYGMLARSRLVTLSPDRLSAFKPAFQKASAVVEVLEEVPTERWPLSLGSLKRDARFAAGVELLRLGLPGAVEELLAVDHRSLSEEPARLVFQILQRSGRGWAARRVARTSLHEEVRGPLSPASRPIWEATWPLAYRSIIERQAKAARVDPDLLQGLIREESRFNPRARSSTGALGLAQLMPATAREVAASLQLPAISEQVLLQPADNIRLGSTYLGQLLKRFGGNPAFAVAAYNAGPMAVERWQRALPQAELDEWVEHIAFEETREYVKRVLGSYSAYKLLYASEPPLLRIVSPQMTGM
ncbi:transglycosylase SLT domain-containing protein [Stigmatella sp. ncwal1]|uniref:Transglycosylase SLT domain-containing protein n=1 Tax=Stigmatella ashevillensis TaxID=2995309 RepID=A0ABT5D372_9BACT|nr:transglycosylase SLT domain-containing protein [Stigmatella ashevillena]MDC0708097.1 transglycosylase SLT domain-containing protein [Stigmatella ashevillena]